MTTILCPSCPSPLPHGWEPLDSDLARLFDVALRELQREDADLAWRFDSGVARHGPDDAEHPGLTYWLFETTLVYLILKAWLPHCDAVWESAYPRGPSQHVDLAIRSGPGELSHAFEAKWWRQASAAGGTMDALGPDVTRLLRYTGPATQRHLVLFWWDKADADTRKKNVDLTETLARDLSNREKGRIPRSGTGQLVRPRYLGHFPTRRRGSTVDFCLCVLSVDA